jgi:hypothetical protein
MTNTAKYFAKSAITGLYWDGKSFGTTEPTTHFNAPEIAFIRATWDNVIAVLLTPEQEANSEGWSPAWLV